MASFAISFAPAAVRVFAATAAKDSGESKKEKNLLDWILGSLEKEHMLETDPLFQKVDDKNGSNAAPRPRKNSVQIPQKKNGGFGGLFAKKD